MPAPYFLQSASYNVAWIDVDVIGAELGRPLGYAIEPFPVEMNATLELGVVLKAGWLQRRPEPITSFQNSLKEAGVNLSVVGDLVSTAMLTIVALGKDYIAGIDREGFVASAYARIERGQTLKCETLDFDACFDARDVETIVHEQPEPVNQAFCPDMKVTAGQEEDIVTPVRLQSQPDVVLRCAFQLAYRPPEQQIDGLDIVSPMAPFGPLPVRVPQRHRPDSVAEHIPKLRASSLCNVSDDNTARLGHTLFIPDSGQGQFASQSGKFYGRGCIIIDSAIFCREGGRYGAPPAARVVVDRRCGRDGRGLGQAGQDD